MTEATSGPRPIAHSPSVAASQPPAPAPLRPPRPPPSVGAEARPAARRSPSASPREAYGRRRVRDRPAPPPRAAVAQLQEASPRPRRLLIPAKFVTSGVTFGLVWGRIRMESLPSFLASCVLRTPVTHRTIRALRAWCRWDPACPPF